MSKNNDKKTHRTACDNIYYNANAISTKVDLKCRYYGIFRKFFQFNNPQYYT